MSKMQWVHQDYVRNDKGELCLRRIEKEKYNSPEDTAKVTITPVSKLGYFKSVEFDFVSDCREIFVATEGYPKKMMCYFKKHAKVTVHEDQEAYFLHWDSKKLFVTQLEGQGITYQFCFGSDPQIAYIESEEEQITRDEANKIFLEHPSYVFRKQNRYGNETAEEGFKREIQRPEEEVR